MSRSAGNSMGNSTVKIPRPSVVAGVQGQGVVTVATGQGFLPGKMNVPETSISELTIFSVSQLPELKSSKVLAREIPACVPSAGHIPSGERGEGVLRKGPSSVSVPRRSWARIRMVEVQNGGIQRAPCPLFFLTT